MIRFERSAPVRALMLFFASAALSLVSACGEDLPKGPKQASKTLTPADMANTQPGQREAYEHYQGFENVISDKEEVVVEERVQTTFDDVAGASEAKTALKEFARLVNDAGTLESAGIRPPQGILMVGEPGTGKTMLARATAHATKATFYSVSATDLIYVDPSEMPTKRLHDLFSEARAHTPAIIFIDELDTFQYAFGMSKQLGIEMDGFSARDGVFVIAATNSTDRLDPSLLRSGRFDHVIHVPMPDARARRDILEMRTRDKALFDAIDLDALAEQTTAMSGADLSNLVNIAALRAWRAGRSTAAMMDFDEAQDDVQIGPVTHDRQPDAATLRRIAIHESGHAAVGLLTDETVGRLRRVTIVPRGGSGGHTSFHHNENQVIQTPSIMRDRIAVLLGARAAEALVYGEASNGVSSDLSQATRQARSMVTVYGMGARVGAAQTEAIEIPGMRMYGDRLPDDVNDDARDILAAEADRAARLLDANRDKLERLADTLLHCTFLTGAEARDVFFSGMQPDCTERLSSN